jgi:hypothetical protein
MKSTYWVVCFALIGLTACKDDKKDTQPFQGRWELTFGELNGRPAPSLEKIFFEFGKDSLKTNFTPSEQEEMVTFQVRDSILIQNTSEPVHYQIETLTDTTLQMTTALKGLDFRLYFKKTGI